MKKIYLIILIIISLLIIGFFAFNSYIYNQKQEEDPEVVIPYQGTLTGEYICLPHKNTTGPQTLECAFGLKTDSGEYFALDFGSNIPNLATGDKYNFTGTITPVEMLSSDYYQNYPIEGILSVESYEKL